MVKSWDTLRQVYDRLDLEEEDLSTLLQLHQSVKEKIQKSELILGLTNSFQLTANQVSGGSDRQQTQLVESRFSGAPSGLLQPPEINVLCSSCKSRKVKWN